MAQEKRSERIAIMVEPSMKAELQALADGIRMPLSTFVHTILQIGLRSAGDTFTMVGNTLEGIIAADKEHDEEHGTEND